jgi:hypothetical protein
LGRVWETIVIARCAKRAVAIQPFDRLTALSEVEGLDSHVAPLLGMTFLEFVRTHHAGSSCFGLS